MSNIYDLFNWERIEFLIQKYVDTLSPKERYTWTREQWWDWLEKEGFKKYPPEE